MNTYNNTMILFSFFSSISSTFNHEVSIKNNNTVNTIQNEHCNTATDDDTISFESNNCIKSGHV